jgi:hypothetical protein
MIQEPQLMRQSGKGKIYSPKGSPPDGGVEETYTNGGRVPYAAGFDGVQRLRYLEDVLRRFVETAPGDLGREAASAGENFCHAAGSHSA